MQPDWGSNSDSESRDKNEEIIRVNRLTPTVCTDPPEPATFIRTNKQTKDILWASRRKEYPLFNSAGAYSGGRLRRVGADSRSQTVYPNDFLILVPTLGIESEPQSACTIRVPFGKNGIRRFVCVRQRQNRSSSVSTMTILWTTERRTVDRFPAEAEILLCTTVQISSAVNQLSYSKGIGIISPRGKAAGAQSWRLPPV